MLLSTLDVKEVVTNWTWNMGMVLQGEEHDFFLDEDDLATHALILGRTGRGKSKWLELLMRYLMASGVDGHSHRGFTFIDIHGDTSEAMLRYALYRKVVKSDASLMDRIHYLEPSYEQVFNYAPFRFRPVEVIPEHLSDSARAAWLHTKVQAVGEILQRKQNQMGFEGMPRLERVLTDVLTAVGTAVGKKGYLRGKHLPLADAMVMLDVFHPRHMEVFQCVAPYLPSYIRTDFDRWHELMRRNPDAILRESESTLNRLRSFLSPVVKGLFCDHVDSIDFFDIIQKDQIILLNLRQTNFFSADQGFAIGGLFIHEMLSAAQSAPPHLRRKHYLIVDEASEFVGGDIKQALGVMRKFEMPILLASQDLSSFVKGELDLRPKVLSQCGTIVSFQQSLPDDLETLVRVIETGDLEFEKHYQIVDRPDGYEVVPMTSYAYNFTWSENWTNAFAVTRSKTESIQRTDSTSRQHSKSRAEGSGKAIQHITTEGETANPKKDDKSVHGSTADGSTLTKTLSESEADGVSDGTAIAAGHSTQRGEQESEGNGGGKGGGLTVNKSVQLVPKTREELHETPSLKNLTTDQFEKMKQQIHGFDKRIAVAKTPKNKRSIVFETAEVTEKWLEEDKWEINALAKKLLKDRPYFTVPQVGNEAENQRLNRFCEADNPVVIEPADAEEPDDIEEQDEDRGDSPLA